MKEPHGSTALCAGAVSVEEAGVRNDMPVPKRKTSRTARDTRRAHDHLTAPAQSLCPQCHQPKLPHTVCPSCGTYKGKEVVQTD